MNFKTIYVAVYNWTNPTIVYVPGYVGAVFNHRISCERWISEKDNPDRWVVLERQLQ